jgi:ribose transport system permease protein
MSTSDNAAQAAQAQAQPSAPRTAGTAERGPQARQRLLPARVMRACSRQTAVVWLITLAAFPLSHFASSGFPSRDLLTSVVTLGVFLAVVSFGQGLVILSGGVDLSLSATIALSAYATGLLCSRYHLATVPAVAVAVALAAAVGAVIGCLIAWLDYPPFIVTLAAGTALASVLRATSSASPAQRSPEDLSVHLGSSARLFHLPVAAWILVAVACAGIYLQHGTVFGRYAYAIGNSRKAADLSGVPSRRVTVQTHVIASAFYGLAGVLLLGYSSGADLNVGEPWLLPSITAVIVGGSSMKGGSGSYTATIGAVLLLTLIGIDINALGLSEGYKQVLFGVIVIVALLGGRLTGRAR